MNIVSLSSTVLLAMSEGMWFLEALKGACGEVDGVVYIPENGSFPVAKWVL